MNRGDADACTAESCAGGVCFNDLIDCDDGDGCTVDDRVAQVASTWGTRTWGILHHSIGKASPGFFERGASNLATEYDEQIRVPHVLKNMGHPVRNSAEDPVCS